MASTLFNEQGVHSEQTRVVFATLEAQKAIAPVPITVRSAFVVVQFVFMKVVRPCRRRETSEVA